MIKIIPKEEIERQNALRYDLLQKKNALAELIFAQQKKQPGFVGTKEQIAELPEGEAKAALAAAYDACATAADKCGAQSTWFTDVQVQIAYLRDQEENKETK